MLSNALSSIILFSEVSYFLAMGYPEIGHITPWNLATSTQKNSENKNK